MDEKYEYYTWQDFAEDVEILAKRIKDSGRKFKNVYGLPKGGLVLAVCLAYRLGIPLIFEPSEIDAKTVIVDDIADTGKTLYLYANPEHFIVTLFYCRQSIVVPEIWLREKKKKYIHHPWEDEAPDTSRWD